jgi:putative oxidoreductase
MSLGLANTIVELRILCGLAFIPHILAKIFKRDMTLGFFRAAGFRPAAGFMYFGLCVEVLVSASLCAGLLVTYAAAIAAIFMLIAGGAAFKVSRGQWFWNLGGCEYHLFWATTCAILALHS